VDLKPKIPNVVVTVLPGTQQEYHNFHRGKSEKETREDYHLSIAEAFSKLSLDKPKTISENYAVDYADGNVALRFYKSIVPQKLTGHFYRVAMSYRGGMNECDTRRTQTLHLGAKEYNPNSDQQEKMPKRVWTQDMGVTKEQTKAILPELVFADNILQQVSQPSYNLKMGIDSTYRMARTGFTRAAVNSANCKLHHDIGVGLDVLMYAGKWAWGGKMVIPQLGIEIEMQPGDIIVMDSGLFHMVTDFQGTRFVVVFFTKHHNKISNSGNVLVVPENLLWLSNPLFSEI